MKQLAQSGELEAYKTDGGHWRISAASVEAMRQGNGDLQQSADRSHQPSTIIRQKKERVEELNLTLQERKAKLALQELEDEQRERAEQEEAARRAQEQESRRMRQEVMSAREQRRQQHEQANAEARARQARREWEDEKLRLAFNSLPADAPREIILDVTEAVRKKLEDLYQSAGHAEDIADKIVLAIAEKESRSWRRSQQAQLAAQKAPEELSVFARNYLGPPTEWQLRATEEALAAIAELPETATFEQMVSAARAAGKSVNDEYRHRENCRSALFGIEGRIAGLLRYASSQEKAKAEKAVRAAFAGLPVGASRSEFDAARDEALAPFIAAESQARADREAAQAKAQAEREAAAVRGQLECDAEAHLYRVRSYLGELEAKPDGWDFEGDVYHYTQRIKQEVKPDLIKDLPLDFTAGRERVEQLVDEWLARHWEPPEDQGQ